MRTGSPPPARNSLFGPVKVESFTSSLCVGQATCLQALNKPGSNPQPCENQKVNLLRTCLFLRKGQPSAAYLGPGHLAEPRSRKKMHAFPPSLGPPTLGQKGSFAKPVTEGSFIFRGGGWVGPAGFSVSSGWFPQVFQGLPGSCGGSTPPPPGLQKHASSGALAPSPRKLATDGAGPGGSFRFCGSLGVSQSPGTPWW